MIGNASLQAKLELGLVEMGLDIGIDKQEKLIAYFNAHS